MGRTNGSRPWTSTSSESSARRASWRQADGSPDVLDKTITGDVVQHAIAIDAKVQHRKWHFNELVRDAVGRSSNERIDATINVRGKFRKHNKDKADGTLEVTLEGGATYWIWT